MTLAGLPGVGEAAAVTHWDPEVGTRTTAYAVPATEPLPDVEARYVRRRREAAATGPGPAVVDRLVGLRARRVVEIGCGDGTLLRALAPHCAEYAACDLSRATIERARADLARLAAPPAATLLLGEAFELDDLPQRHYDLVVLDSVVHCFPGLAHLEQVLRSAVDRVRPGGRVFVGNVRSLALDRAFHALTELTRADPADLASQLRARVAAAERLEDDLLVDPRWFPALRRVLPRITAVELSLRSGPSVGSRFDAVLHLDEAVPATALDVTLTWDPGRGLHPLAEALANGRPRSAFLRGVPDRRCALALAAQRGLDEPLPGATAARLRLACGSAGGVSPEEVADVARRHGYSAHAALDTRSPGHVDVLLTQDGTGQPDVLVAPDVEEPLEGCANAPARVDHARRLAATWGDELARRLPATLAPPALVVLDALPRRPDGRLDLAALPPPVPADRIRRLEGA